jgi:rSAM/selenodomain-associated transferase 2
MGDPAVSVVIPALDEARALPPLIAGLEAQPEDPRFEVILADGGSRDRTLEIFSELTRGWPAGGRRATAIVAPGAGRGAQMNAGARAAAGETLLFLHADTHLPDGAIRAVVEATRDPGVGGGGFRLRYREPGALLRAIAAYATLRSLLRKVHYGDQAIFVRRPLFEAIGGFRETALFEDLELALALRRLGGVRTVPMAAATSARRFVKGGVVRTALRFAWLKARYALGADPGRLRDEYPDVR